ncbi:DUF4179 domain-containing protein [Paenibacillus hunanensis]|uniref:DUF4179 domain-containing protein n=1 Tax=Paenibacillus hunanensis TaxID=539262 RepID=UPI002A69DED0|nr:DUF4179 domain-containing protein [Paenibacillus hunanensis]WPP43252.1 DUF4179 domain-containing protein [Paenibacillus hunanensis]
MNEHDKQPTTPDAKPMHLTQSSPPALPVAVENSAVPANHRSFWAGLRHLFDTRLLVVAVSTFIVICILVTTTWLKPLIGTHSTEASWGELEPFRVYQSEQIGNQSLTSAIEHNYIQKINKSAEQNGYRLTINAVTADENRLILLYTAHTDRDSTIPGLSSVKLRNVATGKLLSNSPARLNGSPDDQNPKQYYGTATVRLNQKQPFPREIAAQFQIMSSNDRTASGVAAANASQVHYSPTLLLHISLAPHFQRQQTEIIYPNRTITWSAHTITLSRVEISPLEMRVRFTADEKVSGGLAKQLWLIPQGIISEKGEESVTLRPIGSRLISENPYTFEHVFYSNLLDNPDSLQLVVKPRDAAAYEDVRIIRIK